MLYENILKELDETEKRYLNVSVDGSIHLTKSNRGLGKNVVLSVDMKGYDYFECGVMIGAIGEMVTNTLYELVKSDLGLFVYV